MPRNSRQRISQSLGAGSVLWILPRIMVVGWVSQSHTVNPHQHPNPFKPLDTLPYSVPGTLASFSIDMFGSRTQSTEQINEKLKPCAHDSFPCRV